MSIKIKVSYTDDQDLAEVIRLLSPIVRSWKKQPAKGKYKRAYGESNNERTTEKGVHTKLEVHTTHTKKKYPDISDTLKRAW